MKKSYFQAIVMLMVFSVFGNAIVFAKTTPPKNNALFARTTHTVFSNPLSGTKTSGAVATNSYWQTQRAKGYVDFTHFYSLVVTAPPTADATQVYAGTATLASLTVTGTAIQWYAAVTGGTALVSTTTLVDGTTYYASQTITSVESTRIPITVRKISEATQTLCSPATIASFVSTPTSGTTAQWFTAATGGIALASGTAVATGTYYVNQSNPTIVSTFAGSRTAGFANATGIAAQFNTPSGVATDASGNVYVADYGNNKIRKITAAGVVTTLAGGASTGNTSGYLDGIGTDAQFNNPLGVALDASGNVYVADSDNHRIRKITPLGVVSTFAGSTYGSADGTGTDAQFYVPVGVATDASGNVYVADYGNNKIRKITPLGVVSTFAGSTLPGGASPGFADGTGTDAKFNGPYGVATDASGNVYVADRGNNKIRKITPLGVVSTFAGSTQGSANGTETNAQFYYPHGVATDAVGNVYVADNNNNKIRKITASGVVTTLAGTGTYGDTDATGTSAEFKSPSAVAIDAAGNVYVADRGSNKIRKIMQSSESNRVAVSDTVNATASPTAEATQIYAGTATLASLTVTGTAIQWYAAATLGTALATTTPLVNGTIYYASQTIASVESCRSAITVRKISEATQTFCAPSFIFNISSTPTSGTTAQWFTAATGGTALETVFTAVKTGTYYVNQKTPVMFSTIVGSGTAGATDATGTDAQFYSPSGVAIDPSGTIYVADSGNHRIRKITVEGVVTTLAGGTSGYLDGIGTAAQFNSPFGVATDASGNVYVADTGNQRIRKITPLGVVSTLAGSTYGSADGTGTTAKFYTPKGVALDASGNVYVADSDNHKIRKITPLGVVSTLAGGTVGFLNGTGIAAKFKDPVSVATDASGNVYVGDKSNHQIRKITTEGVVTTLAGGTSLGSTSGYLDGIGTVAQFNTPSGVATDASGNVYVADYGNNKIRKITSLGVVTSLAGSNLGFPAGAGTANQFNYPIAVATDAAGNLYVADTNNHRIVKITQSVESNREAVSIIVNTTAPPTADATQVYAGTATLASITVTGTAIQWYAAPTLGTVLASSTTLVNGTTYYASQTLACGESTRIPITVIKISEATQAFCTASTVASLASTPTSGSTSKWFTAATGGTALATATSVTTGTYYVNQSTPTMVSIFAGKNSSGSNDGTGITAGFNSPSGVATDASGNVYVADTSNNLIRKITTAGVVTTLAGSINRFSGSVDGTGTNAMFNQPSGVATDASGNVYVADTYNNLIRKITTAGVVTTLAGSTTAGLADGTGASAQFKYPMGVAVDASGNVYVADYGNNKIRKITAAGVVTTLAGGTLTGNTSGYLDAIGTAAKFSGPFGVATDASGNVYVADTGNHKIRKITAAGEVSTFAGTTVGFADGSGTIVAQFYSPSGVALDASGNVYVADTSNHRIRKITPLGVVSVFAGSGTYGALDGAGTVAQFRAPFGVATDASGNVYVADQYNHKIRKITQSSESNRVEVSVTVNTTAAAPSASSQTFCSGIVANLVATGTNLKWYSVATNGTALTTPTALATGMYYVSQTLNTCESTRTSVAVTVNTTVVPTATAQTFCGSKTVNDLVATGTNLKWYSVVTNGTALITSTALATGTYYVSQTLNSCESTRTLVNVTVNTSNIWSGATSTAWNVATNWSCGVPLSGDAIEIPVVTNYPVLDQTRTIGNVSIATGATLSLNNFNLEVLGAFSGTGTLIGGGAASGLTINGSGNQGTFYMNQTTPGTTNKLANFTLNSTVTGSATLGNTMRISGVLTLTNGTFTTGGNLTLTSNGIGTAVVAPITNCGSVAITGDVTVERYFPALRAYRFISSPVTTTTSIRDNWQEGQNNASTLYANNSNTNPGYGTHITGSITGNNGFDATQTTNNSIYTFNNTTNAWAAVQNTNLLTLAAGVPYRLMIRGNRSIDMSTNSPAPTSTTLRTKGVLKICDASAGTLSQNANGFSFIGNPYQATVDIKGVLSSLVPLQSSNVNPNFYYVWDPKVSTRGAYVAYDLDLFVNPLGALSSVNKYLQPWQACFVKTIAAGAASITFKESNKSPLSSVNENVFRTTNLASYIRLTLFENNTLATNGAAADGLIVKFGDNYDNGIDEYDALKFSNLDETFATKNNTSLLGIESRLLPIATDIIPLNITQYRFTNYTMVANGTNLSGLPAYLNDQFLQTYTEIPQSDSVSYPFIVDATTTATSASDRFRIVFQNPFLSLESNAGLTFTMAPNPSKQGVFDVVMNGATEDTKLVIYNTVGQEVYATNLTQASINHIIPNKVFANGVYYVKIKKDASTTIKKLIIR